MAAVQAEDVRASFQCGGDLNGHHQEWFGSTTTNRHGLAEFDFATVSGCEQLVVGMTHARGRSGKTFRTYYGIAVVEPIGNIAIIPYIHIGTHM